MASSCPYVVISIRALLAEGDPGQHKLIIFKPRISIRALLAEGDLRQTIGSRTGYPFQSAPSLRRATSTIITLPSNIKFQSAPSLRRATGLTCSTENCSADFNPRPPCGGRPDMGREVETKTKFQSAPSLRRATTLNNRLFSQKVFQSAPSLRRATNKRR